MSQEPPEKELEKLLRALQGRDLEAIGRRLGLDLHGADSAREFRRRLRRDPALRQQAEALALSMSEEAQCSFCKARASDERKIVTSSSGASICDACLARMKAGDQP